jgi:hypothetical protein
MIKDKLIKKQKELIKTQDEFRERMIDRIIKSFGRPASYNQTMVEVDLKIDKLKSEIPELEKELEQESSKGAEEILFPLIWNKFKYKNNDPFEDKKLLVTIILNNLLQAMEQYRAEGLREELIKFARQFYADEETCIHNVNEYLKQKP